MEMKVIIVYNVAILSLQKMEQKSERYLAVSGNKEIRQKSQSQI